MRVRELPDACLVAPEQAQRLRDLEGDPDRSARVDRLVEDRPRLIAATLVGKDLGDVERHDQGVRVVADLPEGVAGTGCEIDRLVPLAVQVPVAAQVVEHPGEEVEVSELLVDRDRTLGVDRVGRAARA